MPRQEEPGFFDLLQEEAGIAQAMAKALQALMREYEDLPGRRATMEDLEHKADTIVHALHQALNDTFVTPIEREDLRGLASRLDDVVDMLYATIRRLDLYGVEAADDAMRRLADIIVASTGKLREALDRVEDPARGSEVEQLAVEVNDLENQADEVMNEAVAALFESGDAIRVIKLKEIYEKMEEATDYCEDVADILSDIVAKNR
ncbi:MAG: DUF47 family protein [Thermoplasmata archaeon]